MSKRCFFLKMEVIKKIQKPLKCTHRLGSFDIQECFHIVLLCSILELGRVLYVPSGIQSSD